MSAQALAAMCGVAGALGVAFGVGLLIIPRRMLREGTCFWRWLFETDLIALLDRRLAIERPLYRHHYVFGTAVTVGAVALLATLWGMLGDPLATRVLPGIPGAWGVVAAIVASWALALFALGIGMIVIFRPSVLKGFEAAANRWIKSFPAAGESRVEKREGFITRMLPRAPRLTALLVLVGGVASLFAALTIN